MPALTDTLILADATTIPSIGFGTWQIPDGAAAYDAVAAALAAGYRHIDTARAYGNEASVARAIADSGLARDEIYVTTKLPAEVKTYEGALASFEVSMQALGLDYVDLYLIHAPWPWREAGADYAAGNAEAWRAMVGIQASGRVRSIGVSNFTVSDLEKLLATTDTKPQVNQIKFHVGSIQAEVTAYCQANGILVEAYSPLATGAILDDRELSEVAERYGRTVAQICIRYALQKGTLPLPKTTTPSRMAENADVDFEISAADMALLDAIG